MFTAQSQKTHQNWVGAGIGGGCKQVVPARAGGGQGPEGVPDQAAPGHARCPAGPKAARALAQQPLAHPEAPARTWRQGACIAEHEGCLPSEVGTTTAEHALLT